MTNQGTENLEAAINEIFNQFKIMLMKPIEKLQVDCLAKVRAKSTPELTILEEIKEGSI